MRSLFIISCLACRFYAGSCDVWIKENDSNIHLNYHLFTLRQLVGYRCCLSAADCAGRARSIKLLLESLEDLEDLLLSGIRPDRIINELNLTKLRVEALLLQEDVVGIASVDLFGECFSLIQDSKNVLLEFIKALLNGEKEPIDLYHTLHSYLE